MHPSLLAWCNDLSLWPAEAARATQQQLGLSPAPGQVGAIFFKKALLMLFPCMFFFYFYCVLSVLERVESVLFLSVVPGRAVSTWGGRQDGSGRQEL